MVDHVGGVVPALERPRDGDARQLALECLLPVLVRLGPYASDEVGPLAAGHHVREIVKGDVLGAGVGDILEQGEGVDRIGHDLACYRVKM